MITLKRRSRCQRSQWHLSRWHRALALLAVVAAVPVMYLQLTAHAQMRVRPIDLEDGDVALGLVLRHLSNTGVFMQATAHPDDETNALPGQCFDANSAQITGL